MITYWSFCTHVCFVLTCLVSKCSSFKPKLKPIHTQMLVHLYPNHWLILTLPTYIYLRVLSSMFWTLDHSHWNFMVCWNYTNLVSWCDLLFLFVVLPHTNRPSTWQQYYNYSPTNPDINCNPPRTSLMPPRLYRYLMTTN